MRKSGEVSQTIKKIIDKTLVKNFLLITNQLDLKVLNNQRIQRDIF
jgi:hypothetical protein